MASASYAQYIDAIQALEVEGVKRTYENPPTSFNSADMPCKFCWFPDGDNVPLSFGGGVREFKRRTVDLVVVYASTTPKAVQPFEETVAMMDAVETALVGLSVGQSNPNWTIRSQLYEETADRRFWAVIATINGTG